MTKIRKTDILWNPVYGREENSSIDSKVSKDIRATNISLKWRTLKVFLRLIVLIALDILMIFLSWIVTCTINAPKIGVNIFDSMLPIVAISIGTLAASGFYRNDEKMHHFMGLFISLTLSQIVVLITVFFYQSELWGSRSIFLLSWLFNLLFIGGARFLLDLFKMYVYKQKPILLIGNQANIDHVRISLVGSKKFKIHSTIDLSKWDMKSQYEQILAQILSCRVNEVFLCSQKATDNQIILFWNLKAHGIHLRTVLTEMPLPQRIAETKMIEEIPMVNFKSSPISGIDFRLKCFLDWVISLMILIIISPILLLISCLIKISSPGPIFYKQCRIGLKGCQFQVWKFRTMVANASELQKDLETQNEVKGGVLFKIKKDPRITKIGKFLRGYSLDELPQLINVLQGQMSIVGPRPLSVRDYELSMQNFEQLSGDNRFLRYEVLPGITGLWQIKGRINSNSDEIFYWDMLYILKWSLSLDFKILLETIKVVLFKEGSY
jgi:exopolysaccharide biosynthesis polyprenyl glycosylphosphotransferase